MRFVLDMNLSPLWLPVFADRGHDAVHWTEVGRPEAPDVEVMRWARDNERVVVTHDLDFGTLLALTHARGPSVVQARTSEPLPETIGDTLLAAVEEHQSELTAGALLTVDVARNRVRLLPIART